MRTPPSLIRRLSAQHPPPALDIRPGTPDDYEPLAHLHYRAGRPATIDRVLVAVDHAYGITAGVLVTSRPTLNAWWRNAAWPGRFAGLTKANAARRINDELRTISRVIIDPRWRGLGVAARLVRAYLDDPATPLTEALAAMGIASPFFERAGMRRIDGPGPARAARLRRLLGTADASPTHAARALARLSDDKLRAWARASASTRRITARAQIEAAALGALIAPPVPYAAG